MNPNAAAKYYHCLTPEERFRLLLAASARGDAAERARLISAGQTIRLVMADHAPYAAAFHEVALALFTDLVEEAAVYQDASRRVDAVAFEEAAEAGQQPDAASSGIAPADSVARSKSMWLRCLDLALAAGYVLRAKVDGWKLFCTRLTMPPFAQWEGWPGLERLKRALVLAEGSDALPGAAFEAEGMLRFLNGIRPQREPELAQVQLTARAIADELEGIYRTTVAHQGGPARSSG